MCSYLMMCCCVHCRFQWLQMSLSSWLQRWLLSDRHWWVSVISLSSQLLVCQPCWALWVLLFPQVAVSCDCPTAGDMAHCVDLHWWRSLPHRSSCGSRMLLQETVSFSQKLLFTYFLFHPFRQPNLFACMHVLGLMKLCDFLWLLTTHL